MMNDSIRQHIIHLLVLDIHRLVENKILDIQKTVGDRIPDITHLEIAISMIIAIRDTTITGAGLHLSIIHLDIRLQGIQIIIITIDLDLQDIIIIQVAAKVENDPITIEDGMIGTEIVILEGIGKTIEDLPKKESILCYLSH